MGGIWYGLHDVEWRVGVLMSHHVVPQSRAAPGVFIRADAEAIAREEEYAHRLGHGGDEETVALRLCGSGRESQPFDGVLPPGLKLPIHLDFNVELPEGVAGVRVKDFCACLNRLRKAIHGHTVGLGLFVSVKRDATDFENNPGLVVNHVLPATVTNAEDTSNPLVSFHAAVV